MTKQLLLFFLVISSLAFADDGSRLWLNYDLIKDAKQRESYAQLAKFIVVSSDNQTIKIASEELQIGLQGLLGKKVAIVKTATGSGCSPASISASQKSALPVRL